MIKRRTLGCRTLVDCTVSNPGRDAVKLQNIANAGWYDAPVRGGEGFRPFDPILIELLPALASTGYLPTEIDALLVRNAARALTVALRERS